MKTGAMVAGLAMLGLAGFLTVAYGQTAKRAPQPANNVTGAADSTPDLSGVWTPAPPAHPIDPALFGVGRKETIPPDLDQADYFTFLHSPYPMQPWAQEKFNYNRHPENPYGHGRNELNPLLAQCAPLGPTGSWQDFFPFEIIQSPKRVLIIFEENHEIRQIWTDGRKHPKDFGHNWMGHSIGHWEGDTLVADTIGLNDLTWLDRAGHVHSDELHLVERLQRAGDKLMLNILFDDPKAFTMPFTARKTYQLKPNWDLEEAITCEDKLLGRPVPLQ